jgi:hypothetical protein
MSFLNVNIEANQFSHDYYTLDKGIKRNQIIVLSCALFHRPLPKQLRLSYHSDNYDLHTGEKKENNNKSLIIYMKMK